MMWRIWILAGVFVLHVIGALLAYRLEKTYYHRVWLARIGPQAPSDRKECVFAAIAFGWIAVVGTWVALAPKRQEQ